MIRIEPEPVVLRPEDLANKRVSTIIDGIIQTLVTHKELDVVGISSAIFLACSSANIVASVSKFNASKISIDYLEYPVIGKFEAIFLTLSKEGSSNHVERVKALESEIVGGPGGSVVAVTKQDRLERITSLCLFRLREYSLVKILAAGTAITGAVLAALQVSKGGIAREEVGIPLVDLSSIPRREPEGKSTTAIAIYLKRGHKTDYDVHHEELKKYLTTRQP